MPSEYKYRISKLFKASKTGLCMVCDKKFGSRYDVGACQPCFKKLTITKTNAKKIYGMTDEDLEEMHVHQRSSPYHDCVSYYSLKEVRLQAITKKYGIYNPSKQIYKNCLEEIHEEHKNIEANKVTRYDKKRAKLEQALAQHGLPIRGDSYYCNQFLHYNKFKLKEVVDMMVTMDFFMTKTNYNAILGDLIADNGGVYEEDKADAKYAALKKYLKKHDKDSVPQVVLDHYYREDDDSDDEPVKKKPKKKPKKPKSRKIVLDFGDD